MKTYTFVARVYRPTLVALTGKDSPINAGSRRAVARVGLFRGRSATPAAIALACFANPAMAQAPLAAARASYENAEFEQALDAIAEDEREGTFDRDTFVDLLRLRATILFALGRDGWRNDLRLIAAVTPEAELGPESPPPMHDAYEAIRGRTPTIVLDAEAETFPDGVLLRTEATSTPPGLEVRYQLFGRSGGDEWLRGEQRLMIEAPDGLVEYYSELLGPGNSVLRTAGARTAPLRHLWQGPPRRGVAAGSVESNDGDENDDGASPWPWIGLGTGVVVAIAAVAVILLVTHQPDTRVTLPSPP